MSSQNHVIVLVHGARDYALWQDRIRHVLAEHFIVESTNYGRFDLIRLLLPLSYFRDKAIQRVWDQIRDVKKQNPKAKFSFIAHSFGTYIIATILRREFDFVAFRIVFCGSIVKYHYPFEQIADRFTTPILNEVGSKDYWPAIAESVTWGYGSAGTYGFRRPRVRDRWHANARHGYFLDPEFCRRNWVPFFKDGTIVVGAKDPIDPPAWVKMLSIIRLKYLFAVVFLGASVLAAAPRTFEPLAAIAASVVPTLFSKSSALSPVTPEVAAQVRLVIHLPKDGDSDLASRIRQMLEQNGILTTGIVNYNISSAVRGGEVVYYVDDDQAVALAIVDALAPELALQAEKSSLLGAASGLIDIWLPKVEL